MYSRYRRIGESTRSPDQSPSRSGSRARSRSPVKSSAVKESRLESALRSTEEERDYYKREYELQVRDQCTILPKRKTLCAMSSVHYVRTVKASSLKHPPLSTTFLSTIPDHCKIKILGMILQCVSFEFNGLSCFELID